VNRPTSLLRGLALPGVGAVLACVLVTGCGSSADEPAATSSPSVSSSGSGSESGSTGSSAPADASELPGQDLPGPDLPQDALAQTENAARSFVSYYIATLNDATSSGDTRLLKTLSTQTCNACSGFAATLDEIYGKGGHVETQGWAIDSIVPQADTPPERPAFQLSLKVAPQTVYQTKKAQPKDYPGGEQPAHFILTWQDGRWLVDRLDI
jgi:hypothetical protein